jgi:hypothetical protein
MCIYSMVGALGAEAWKGLYQNIRLMKNNDFSVLVGQISVSLPF